MQKKHFIPLLDNKGKRIQNFYVYSPNGTIYFKKKFKKLGIPDFFGPTGEKTIGRARTKVEVLIQKHKNRHLGIDDSDIFERKTGTSFGEIADEVLKYVKPKKRPRTQENYEFFIKVLKEKFGKQDINKITVKKYEDWISELRKTSKRTTFMDYAKYMNKIMRYAYQTKRTTHLLTFTHDDPHAADGRIYTDSEISKLWDCMNDDLKDQFVLSYECMMRLREVLFLTWDRVDLKTGKIVLRKEDVKTGTQTGQGREFIVTDHAKQRLRDRYKRAKGSRYVFPSPQDEDAPMWSNKTAWANAKKAAGISGRATWHSLRHTAISKALLEAGISPVHVSKYAGVSIRTIEAVYLKAKAEQTKEVSTAVSIFKKG